MDFKTSGKDLVAFDSVVYALDKFKSKTFKEIEFCSIHGNVINPEKYFDRKKIWILSYCFPNNNYRTGKINSIKIGGKKIELDSGLKDAYLPNENSFKDLKVTELKDEDGGVFGCIVYNVAMVFFDLPHWNSRNKMTRTDYNFLLKNIFKQIEKNISPYNTRAKKRQYLERFINQGSELLKIKIDQINNDIRSKNDYIERYQKDIIRFGRESMLSRKQLESIKKLDLKTKIVKVLRSINKMPEVDYVDFLSNSCVIHTKVLEIDFEGEIYDIGRYKIIFHTSGGLEVRSKDKINRDCHYEHPHIDNGNCCLGNAAGVLKMISSFDFDAALVVLLKYLKSYRYDDAYINILEWHERVFDFKSNAEYREKHGE